MNKRTLLKDIGHYFKETADKSYELIEETQTLIDKATAIQKESERLIREAKKIRQSRTKSTKSKPDDS